MTYPPQCGGRGTSPSPKRSSAAAIRRSSSDLSAMGADWGDAHAPILLARGRDAKYASLTSSGAVLTVPRMRTWRWICSHPNTAATGAPPAIWRPFVLRRFVWNVIPFSSIALASTMRESGAPSASTVDTVIAFGSVQPASSAWAYHFSNCVTGLSWRSARSSPAVSYWMRKSPMPTRVTSGGSLWRRACKGAEPRGCARCRPPGGSSRRWQPTRAARRVHCRSGCWRSRCPSVRRA